MFAVRARLGAALAAIAGALSLAVPAEAVPDPGLGAPPRAGAPPPEVVLSGLGPGHGVTGQIGPAGSVSDPSVPYPPDTTGFTPLNEGFAGIILATPQGGGTPLQMYCINIRTPTNVGFGYDLGTWGDANVNNVGFVARLLNTYYPNGSLPPIGVNGVANTADQAAAVQSAIWYFSDNYVLAAGNPLLAAVARPPPRRRPPRPPPRRRCPIRQRQSPARPRPRPQRRRRRRRRRQCRPRASLERRPPSPAVRRPEPAAIRTRPPRSASSSPA